MMNSYQPGELIFVQGQASECVYLIESGEIELLESTEDMRTVRIAKLIKGDLLGEMALVDERPRAFSARAVTETTVSIVSREQFVKLMFRDPAEGLRYLGAFFERLRATNKPPGSKVTEEPQKSSAHIRILPLTKTAKQAIPDEGLIVTRFPFRVGREPPEGKSRLSSNDLGLKDTDPYQVSREHFSIEVDAEGVMLYDRGSFHGTIVNGAQIGGNRMIGSVRLQAGGNEIIAGEPDSPFRFSVQVSEG
jgi:hypothetical protein